MEDTVASKKTAPKRVPIDEPKRRKAAADEADKLYGKDWQSQAIINKEQPLININLEELAQFGPRNCTTADICRYLTALSKWFVWFQHDYTKLRRAVCNVERQAFGGVGDPALRFCSNGTGSEPADPTPPPIWH